MDAVFEAVVVYNKGLFAGFLLGILCGVLLANYLMFRD